MKQYLIKNSDIMHNGKLFPEGSTINLDDKDAQLLSDYLTEIIEVSKNNSDQKTNNKRSK
jgi:hypothetical protein